MIIVSKYEIMKLVSESWSQVQNTKKRYFIIDQQIERYFVQYSESLSNLLPFYATQLINPFWIQGSQPITIKGWDFNQS